jgi:hypothetical protein
MTGMKCNNLVIAEGAAGEKRERIALRELKNDGIPALFLPDGVPAIKAASAIDLLLGVTKQSMVH